MVDGPLDGCIAGDLFLRTHELARFARLLPQDGRYGQHAVIRPRRRAAVTAHSDHEVELLDAIHDLVLDRLN